MKTRLQTLVLGTLFTLAGAVSAAGVTSQATIAERYGKLPLSFEANQGQSDAEVKFISRGQGYNLFLTPGEAVLALSKPSPDIGKEGNQLKEKKADDTAVVRMTLSGARQRPEITGLQPLPGKSNYFIGQDPKQWHTTVPHFAKVRYEEVYPGIDVVYYGKQRELEYDFVVQPGANPNHIKLAYSGVDKLHIDKQGQLILTTSGGVLTQQQPFIYQEVDGQRRRVDGGYLLDDANRVSFRLAHYDANRPLIIDPVLSYSTYLGGSDTDAGLDIAIDGAGNAYITGETRSTNFPTLNPFQNLSSIDGDAFVTKLAPGGNNLIYSTYLAGNGRDRGESIALDVTGNAYIAGYTTSSNFPTANAFDATYGGSGDVFVVKLAPAGNALVYSTYLGGSGAEINLVDEYSRAGIAVDIAGSAYVVGDTQYGNFPVTAGAFDTTCNAGTLFFCPVDIFVTKFTPAGNALVYSTYLGGSNELDGGDDDYGGDIAIDAAGHAYVTGSTDSNSFPVKNPFQATHNGYSLDAFVSKLSPNGATLVYSTYLGSPDQDIGRAIAVDSMNNAYVTGDAGGVGFPIKNAFRSSAPGNGDVFVTKFAPAGNTLVYSTYLGGTGNDLGRGIAVNSLGQAFVTGNTTSTNFPTRNPTQAAAGGFGDGFVTQFAPAGNTLIFSTYLGGNGSGVDGEGSDIAYGIAVDSCSTAFVTGQTASPAFPVVTPFQAARRGLSDAFVTRIAPSASITLQFSKATFSVNEGTATATITVQRCGSRSGTVSVNYATSNGTAVSGSDYTPASGTLTFANNQVSKTFTVGIVNDATVEASETVRLTLSGPTGAILGTPNTATLTILDNEPAQLRFSSATYSANETSLKATITVSRIGSLTGTSSVKYATANGTAMAGADYTAATGTVSFTAGINSKTFNVPIINDTTREGNETVNLALSAPVGATLAAPSSAALTIVSNE